MCIDLDAEKQTEELRQKLLGSFLFFIQTFFKLRTGRDFEVTQPIGRESHIITICKELTLVKNLEVQRLMINVEPGSGKSEIVRHFIAWCLAHYPDSKFIYASYSKELAMENTAYIKQIVQMPHYRKIFGINIKDDSSAKAHFKTDQNGAVYAAGSAGTITGFDAGFPMEDRFTGAFIMDDMHKPSEVFSDVTREYVKDNFKNTLIHRARSPNVPFIFIGQRLHEDDLPGSLINGFDGYNWKKVILKSIDEAGNILNPRVHDQEFLDNLSKHSQYEFSSQYQQDPIPAGGGIFKKDDFKLLSQMPKILSTFITCDTAETSNNYNDATVFSFWGIYKISLNDIETDIYALHWLDCNQLWVEPKDLQPEFMAFYARCMRFDVKPRFCAIEKKSTGTTLLSLLKDVQGINVIDIQRTKASGSKTIRFLEIQPYVSKKLITFSSNASHAEECIDHCAKITLNNTHRYDDIADTLYDAVKFALIDQIIPNTMDRSIINEDKSVGLNIIKRHNRLKDLKDRRYAKWK